MSILETTNLISKYDKKDLYDLKNAIKDDNIIITCIGLYNHGKSTLLNVLLEDLDMNTFKVADARETTKNKEFAHNGVLFMDTPGLNAQKNDDKRVMDAVKKSDINLFVHSITTGEFQEKEISFLNHIQKHWASPEEFIERTIFVLSRMDSVDEEETENAINKMRLQIQEWFKSTATIIAVSSSRYAKGMKENKKILVSKSNIVDLQEKITNIVSSSSDKIKENKKKRFDEYKSNLIKSLTCKKEENLENITLIDRRAKKRTSELNEDVKNINNTLRNYGNSDIDGVLHAGFGFLATLNK